MDEREKRELTFWGLFFLMVGTTLNGIPAVISVAISLVFMVIGLVM